MRVLLIHNRYQQAGGEDAVAANEHALLLRHGWDVRLLTVDNDRISGAWNKLTTAVRTPYSFVARRMLAGVLAEFLPDVVHVHNFFPLLSPSIYDACRAAGTAVVQTLHNYRIACPGGILTRNGRPCEKCLGATPYPAILHACYRGSRAGSLAVAGMVEWHRRVGTWTRKVDRFIALSAFSKSRFVAAGLPPHLIAVKPNFVEDRPVTSQQRARAGALYVGRLTPEKGVDTLLRAWQHLEVPLQVLGDGPLLPRIEAAAHAGISVRGWGSADQVAAAMARASFLVVPSQNYENFPLVIAEAFCRGLPVIASRIGALAEIVEDGRTGLHFDAEDAADLSAKVAWAARHPDAMRAMGEAARRIYEARYSPSVNLGQLTRIYEAALAHRRSAAASGSGSTRPAPAGSALRVEAPMAGAEDVAAANRSGNRQPGNSIPDGTRAGPRRFWSQSGTPPPAVTTEQRSST